MREKGYWDFARYGSIGISWVLSSSVYFYLGYKGGTYVDERLGSEPWFLVLGLLLAMALSLKTLIGEIMAIIERTSSDKGSDSK